MKLGYKNHFGWEWSKSRKWRPDPSTLLTFGYAIFFLTLFFGIAEAQTPIANTTKPQGSNGRDVTLLSQTWKKISGLADFFPPPLLPALKIEMGLTDDQIKLVKDIKELLIENRQRESHNFPESMPLNPEDEKNFKNHCDEKIIKLHQLLGDDKFDDFCEYVQEENAIVGKVERLEFEKTDFSNTDYYSNQLFDEITKGGFYKSYKQKKIDSQTTGSSDFSKHEKGLKLRILYQLTSRAPVTNGKKSLREIHEEGKERKQKINSVLTDLNKLN